MNNFLAAKPVGEIENPLLGDDLNSLLLSSPTAILQEYLPSMIGLLMVFGTVAFFLMFLTGAISWILSGGDKAKLEGAKGKITSAIVGLVLLLSVFALSKLTETFFGINILTIDIGPLVIQ